MKNLYLCDFNDSFTYNIFSTLSEFYPDVEVKVVSEENLDGLFQVIIAEDEACGIILGPGPGHPYRYEHLFNSLEVIFAKPNIFVMGICLGHQLYWLLKGYSVEHCQRPSHGQIVRYELPTSISEKFSLPLSISVQRYNSLAVILEAEAHKSLEVDGHKVFQVDNEVIMSVGPNLVTYQFHPESIGTTCPEQFFKQLVDFLV